MSSSDRNRLTSLTPREREVLAYAAEGYGNKAIAEILDIKSGAPSIGQYLNRIYGKLEAATPEAFGGGKVKKWVAARIYLKEVGALREY